MKEMFAGCKVLEYLDLSSFTTINVTDMTGMFKECHKLRQIKGINVFNNYQNTKTIDMFKGCYELKDINLSLFNNSVNDNNKKNERPIKIKFVSSDQRINHTVICYKTDEFSKIQKELFDKFPELKTQGVYFIACGNLITESMTLEQNGIRSNTTILINKL